MNFHECLMKCAGNAEFVREFDRLAGCNLSRSGSPINIMVDEACGKHKDDMKKFVDFCWESIYIPLSETVDV